MGRVEMYGASKEPYAIPTNKLISGTSTLYFDISTRWQIGDTLVFPATEYNGQDELRTIVEVQSAGKLIRLDRDLDDNHVLPDVIGNKVPVENLTRNIRISTRENVPLRLRAHTMFMHRQTGVVIDGVSFNRMGRTDAKQTHTVAIESGEKPLPEELSNSIGRYSLHFHIRTGADRSVAPHIVKNSVIRDCAKHGVVNHGGHVEVSSNVTFQCTGSHFFAENGSEIGSFKNNLAIRSEGSGESFLSREANFDFGHGGHGLWVQGDGGVDVSGNFAFGHANSAYFYFGQYMLEDNKVVYFDAKNIKRPEFFEELDTVFPRDIPIFFSNNLAVSSLRGLDIWNHKEHASHNLSSIISDSSFYANKHNAIFIPYSKNLVLRNIIAIGTDGLKGIGVNTNTKTSGLVVEDSIVEGYLVGLELPRHGATKIDRLTMSNVINFRIWSPLSRNRTVELKNVSFNDLVEWSDLLDQGVSEVLGQLKLLKRQQYDFYMEGVRPTERGDLSMVFEPTQIVVESRDNDYVGKQIYFPEQSADFTPFSNTGVMELDDKSNRQLWNTWKLAVGGILLPQGAQRYSRVKGYVGRISEYFPSISEEYFEVNPTVYKGDYLKNFSDNEYQEGWNFIPLSINGKERTVMLYADRTPPSLSLDSFVPFVIHPDDVPFGLRLQGDDIDYVAGIRTVNRVNREYRDLLVTEAGLIEVEYPITDSAGNINNVKYTVTVSEDAPRRGQDLAHYLRN